MLNEKYVSKILFLAFLASLLGFAFQAEAAQVRTRSGCLHLRSSNSSWGSLYKTGQCLPSGTDVQIIGRHKRNRKYLKVIVDGQVGYLWSRNIDRSRQGFNSQPHSRRHRPRRNNNRNQTPRIGRQAQIQTPQGDCLRLRSSRSAWGSLRKTGRCFKPGTKVKVIGRHKRNRKYLKVMVNGRTGYMWSPHLDQSNSQPDDIADSKPQKPRKKQMELPIRKKQEPKISDKGKKKKTPPKDLDDINLDIFAAGEDKPEKKKPAKPKDKKQKAAPKDLDDINLDIFAAGEDQPEKKSPVKPRGFIADKGEKKESPPESKELIADKAEKIDPRTEKPAEKVEQAPTDEKEAETKVEKATAKYKKTLKAAREAERVAREKEKRAEKLKGSTAYNEALREAQQKRLAADSLFKSVKEQYSDLIDSGLAKNVPVPVIDLRKEDSKKQQAEVEKKKEQTSPQEEKIVQREEKKKVDPQIEIDKKKKEAETLAEKQRLAEIEKQRLAEETERNRLAEEKRLADEAEAEKQRLADEAERKRLADIKAQQDAKKKKEAARKKMIADFRKKARRKPICVKGERNLKKNTLWAIMKQNKIPSPYGTKWRGIRRERNLPMGACTFKGVCGDVHINIKFNKNGTYSGYGTTRNSSGRRYTIKDSKDKGLLRVCYRRVKSRGKYRDKVFIHSRSFQDGKEIRNTITSKTKSWTFKHDQLGGVKMTTVNR